MTEEEKREEKEKEEEQTEEEDLEETLEELEEAVEEEVEEEKEKIEESGGETEGPITLFLKDPELSKQVEKIREATGNGIKGITETGISKTHENVIIFYEHATSWGDRIRGLVFFLLGASLVGTGLLANYQNYFSLKELILIITTWAGRWISRIIIAIIGISLMAYGTDKLFSGLKDNLFPPEEEEKPYVQKRLVEEKE